MVITSSFLSNQDTVFPQLHNSTQLRHAYTSVLTVTMASDQSFYETFRELQLNREIRSPVAVTQVMLLKCAGQEWAWPSGAAEASGQLCDWMFLSTLIPNPAGGSELLCQGGQRSPPSDMLIRTQQVLLRWRSSPSTVVRNSIRDPLAKNWI